MIVGLQTDPSIDREDKAKPTQSIFERWTQLESIKYIDKIIPYDSEASLMELLNSIPIDLRIIGEEYKKKEFTGKGLHEVYYNNRQHSFSSTELRERIRENNGK